MVQAKPLVRPIFQSFQPCFEVAQDTWDYLRKIDRLDAELETIPVSLELQQELYRDSLARNAFATAQIEGNPHSLEEVSHLFQVTKVPTDREAPDEKEFLTWRAVVDAIEQHAVPASPRDLCGLHAELFDGVLAPEKKPGKLKDVPNAIGSSKHGITYIPAAPQRVAPELQNALDWFHTSPEHPIVRAAILFHEFESIHPFLDGNGRLGRLLFMLCLHHGGYPYVRYAPIDYAFNEDRNRYYQELAIVEQAGWDFTSWIAYIAEVLATTYEEVVNRFSFQHALPPMPEEAAAVARWLHRNGRTKWVRFGNIHAALPGLARRTLQRHLARLVAAGIVVREGERKAARYRIKML